MLYRFNIAWCWVSNFVQPASLAQLRQNKASIRMRLGTQIRAAAIIPTEVLLIKPPKELIGSGPV